MYFATYLRFSRLVLTLISWEHLASLISELWNIPAVISVNTEDHFWFNQSTVLQPGMICLSLSARHIEQEYQLLDMYEALSLKTERWNCSHAKHLRCRQHGHPLN